jgi:hypothetical protein
VLVYVASWPDLINFDHQLILINFVKNAPTADLVPATSWLALEFLDVWAPRAAWSIAVKH